MADGILAKLFLASGLLVALAGCAPGKKCGAGDAVLGYYDAHIRNLDAGEYGLDGHFSAGLERLLQESDFFLDWDPWLMAQDWDEPDVKVVKVSGSKARPVVTVSVTDLGTTQTTDVCLVKENGTYMVDNFVTEAYDLRTLLSSGMK